MCGTYCGGSLIQKGCWILDPVYILFQTILLFEISKKSNMHAHLLLEQVLNLCNRPHSKQAISLRSNVNACLFETRQ